MKRERLQTKLMRIMAAFMVFVMCVISLGEISWAAESVEDSTDGVEKVRLWGEILDMGYEFSAPKTRLEDNIRIRAVCKEDNTVVQMLTSKGEYSLDLERNKVYTVTYSGYISGRMANMTIPVSILTTEDKELNLIIRTNNVPGFSIDNEYLEQYPTHSIVIRRLNSGYWFDESLSVEPANVELSIKGEQQLQVKSASGLVYENGYEYQSSDPSVATVDENGVVTAVKKGKAVITCSMKGEDGLTAESQIEVNGGFDYTKDGYCFVNSQSAFSYGEGEYYIPFERYQEIFGDTVTKNFYDSILKEVWDGNCFGMSLTAILFYKNHLQKKKYAPKCYDKGETINQGFYDKFATDENGNNLHTVVSKDSELTKLIERYQIWQVGPEGEEWEKNALVSAEDVVKNWDSGKSYIVGLKWWYKNEAGEEKSCGHCVAIDMHGDAPIRNENGEYEFLIYDPNYPAFTDEQADFTTLCQDVYLKVSKDGYEVKTALNADEATSLCSGTRDDIKFYEIDLDNHSIPADFHGDAKWLTWLGKIIMRDTSNVKVTDVQNGQEKPVLEMKDSKVIYQADGVELEYDYDVDAGTTGENSFSFEYDSQDLRIEMPDGGKCFMLTANSIDGVVLDGKSEIRTSSEGISVETEEATNVSLLTESHHGDGTITSILADGKSEAGNIITCSLNENDQYTLKSTKDMEANLTLNTEDSNVEKEKTMVARSDSEAVNVVKYVGGEETTPTPSVGATEVPTQIPSITETPTEAPTQAPSVTPDTKITATPTPAATVLQQKTQTITAKNITKTYGNKAFRIGAKTNGNGKLSFTSGNKKVAVVSKGGKVTIKGCGKTILTIKASETKEYKATEKKITLTVKPKQQKVSSAKSTKAKTITVKWKKDTKATGYILEYSTDKKFKKNVKRIAILNNKTTSKDIKKLKSGKKYYVKVCSYKKYSGTKIKGSYSKVRTVKVKK